jgi:hypothetical protein
MSASSKRAKRDLPGSLAGSKRDLLFRLQSLFQQPREPLRRRQIRTAGRPFSRHLDADDYAGVSTTPPVPDTFQVVRAVGAGSGPSNFT